MGVQGPHLIYFGDPMCSWCWGFAPSIAAIEQQFGATLPIRLILGGLRPGNTRPLTDEYKATLREHWGHVHEASGQPFDMGFFDRAGFVYDTEPAARAAVVMRRKSQVIGIAALHRLQQAFYAENQDITRDDVLIGIATEFGFDAAAFAADFRAAAAREETARDFAISQQTGITGFPTVIAGTGRKDEYALVTQGFQPPGRLIPALLNWYGKMDAQARVGAI